MERVLIGYQLYLALTLSSGPSKCGYGQFSCVCEQFVARQSSYYGDRADTLVAVYGSCLFILDLSIQGEGS